MLHVALQEGFNGERVTAAINGREFFSRTGVKTRMQIGLADSFELDQPPGRATLAVSIPERGATRSLELQLDQAPLYVAVSLDTSGQIQMRTSREPFGYV